MNWSEGSIKYNYLNCNIRVGIPKLCLLFTLHSLSLQLFPFKTASVFYSATFKIKKKKRKLVSAAKLRDLEFNSSRDERTCVQVDSVVANIISTYWQLAIIKQKDRVTKSWIWCCPVYLLNETCLRDKAALECTQCSSFPTSGEISKESKKNKSASEGNFVPLHKVGSNSYPFQLGQMLCNSFRRGWVVSHYMSSLKALWSWQLMKDYAEEEELHTSYTGLLFLHSFFNSKTTAGGGKLPFSLVLPGFHLLCWFLRSASAYIKRSFPTCWNQHFQLVEINTWDSSRANK